MSTPCDCGHDGLHVSDYECIRWLRVERSKQAVMDAARIVELTAALKVAGEALRVALTQENCGCATCSQMVNAMSENMGATLPCAALLRVNGSDSFRHCERDSLPNDRYCELHSVEKYRVVPLPCERCGEMAEVFIAMLNTGTMSERASLLLNSQLREWGFIE